MKVSMRGGFSDRNVIKPENTTIQLKNFDKRTRIQLQNMISTQYADIFGHLSYSNSDVQEFLKYVIGTVYSNPLDARKTYDDDRTLEQIGNTILNDAYDDVLTVIEALIRYWDCYLKKRIGYEYYDVYSKTYNSESIFEVANKCFEKEYVGYRFIDGIILPISDDIEVKTIQETLSNKYQPVYDHISKANQLLADREHPDYENSIKESISAVEAICEILTGAKGNDATLGKMLKKLEDNGVVIHSALKSAFNTLYGYTSDANGIRHAGDIGGPSSTFEEAKFMLVACCSFINYLIALSAD
ncbi:MAG TPA: hypothetical protein P5529_04090 [Saccharofermentans sp.]|nr:hypothetical protein [Saccharofermentans sp.]